MTKNIPIILNVSKFGLSGLLSIASEDIIFIVGTLVLKLIGWLFRKQNKK